MADTRGIFCNRTLNLRSIQAIGYDMDYTLVHYRMEDWERIAYEHLRDALASHGLPVSDLEFDPELAMRGLVIDTERGNLAKASRFGWVMRACHGTTALTFPELREAYAGTFVDLSDSRWRFLNTLFAISEACMYLQLVDLLDAGRLEGVLGYGDLYRLVRRSLDEAHMEGSLKQEIARDPARFIEPDPEMPRALLDQKDAGKQLLLVTNSEWSYARVILDHVFEGHLPGSMGWRDLFDYVVVGARKPDFFAVKMPTFRLLDDAGRLEEHRGPLERGGIYVGGNAALVESSLGLDGAQILYVGDHIFVDVHLTKSLLRWRTALIVRELEDEVAALESFESRQAELSVLMEQKTELEAQHARARLEVSRSRAGRQTADSEALEARVASVRAELEALDGRIAPLARASGELMNRRWGLLMRAGNDKSHLARQVERYADVYTSRVSNFLAATPFVYLRAPRGSLPHDP